ncbi:MAG: hypothetical protein ACE5D7_10970, partial [Fidelibacterota bacterium]
LKIIICIGSDKMNTRLLILFLSALTLLAGCRRDFSAIDTPELSLTAEDVGVTEALTCPDYIYRK